MVKFRHFTNAKHTAWLLEVDPKQFRAYATNEPFRWRMFHIQNKFVYLDEQTAVDFLTELRQRGIEFDTEMVVL